MSRIRLTWDIGAFNPEKHYIYRSDSEISPNNLPAPIAEVGQGVNEFDDDGIVEGNTYHYFVAAEKKGLLVPAKASVGVLTNLIHPSLRLYYSLDGSLEEKFEREEGKLYEGSESYSDGPTAGSLSLDSPTAIFKFNQAVVDDVMQGDFSISLWCYTTDTSGNWQTIVTNGYGSPFSVRWSRNTNTLRIGGNSSNFSSIQPPSSEWFHLGITYSGGVAEAYFNGEIDNSGNIGSVFSSSNPLILGRGHTSMDSGQRWNGRFSHVKFYESKISSDQMKLDYDLFKTGDD